MHTLAQSWLDIDIPTTTNPTMRRRWANVALAVNHYPTSRTIEMHMLPQCWLDIDILTMHQIPPCADVGPALPARPSPDIAHTENAYVGSTSKFQPRPIRRCTGIGSTLPGRPSLDVAHNQNAYVGSTSTCRLRPIRPCADIGPCNVALAVNHYPTSRTIEMHMLPQ